MTYHVFNAETFLYQKLCKRAAYYLTGRHKPIYRPNKSFYGDTVIIANCNNIRMRRDELKYAKLRYHTGAPGGLKTKYFKDYIDKNASFLFYHGIYKELPKNKLRYDFMERLYAYNGPEVEFADFLPNFTSAPEIDKNKLFTDFLSKGKIVEGDVDNIRRIISKGTQRNGNRPRTRKRDGRKRKKIQSQKGNSKGHQQIPQMG